MSFGSQYNLNQRVTYLESIIQTIAPFLPFNLSNVLTLGNSAGTNDIDMNNNDILNCDNIQVNTINGGSYPPATPDLSQVLTAGNTANNSIVLDDTVSLTNTIDTGSINITDGAFTTNITNSSVNVVDVNNSKNIVIDVTQGTLTNNDGAIIYSQMFANQFKVSDGYGTQNISTLSNTALTIIDVANTTTATLNSNSLTTQNTIGQYSSVSLGSFSVIDTPNSVSSSLSANNLVITDTLASKNATLNNSQGLIFNDNNQKGSYLRADLFSIYNTDPLLGPEVALSIDAFGGYKIDSLTSSTITTLNSGSLTFSNSTSGFSSSLTFGAISGDFILDANTNRLLLNAGNNEFYIGEYSVGTAPVIISTGSSGMSLNVNSRSGITNIGDCDNAFNQTKISVDDTSSLIVLETTSTAVIGDNNGLTTNAKLSFDIANSEMNWLGNGVGQASFDTGVFNAGDLNNVSNGMKIKIDDANSVINIDNNGDAIINIGDISGGGNATKLIVNDASSTFTIDFPTINFANTTITTSSSTHTAEIKATSNGLETTTFLKCKLNGNDIWIPYFTTDPSL